MFCAGKSVKLKLLFIHLLIWKITDDFWDQCKFRRWVCGSSSVFWADLDQVVVGTVQVFIQLDHQALEKRREFLLLLPRLQSKQIAIRKTSVKTHNRSHTCVKHSEADSQTQTTVAMSLLIATLLIKNPREAGWDQKKKKEDARHSQSQLPPSSTRNICGLWNLNALCRCSENIRAFCSQARGTRKMQNPSAFKTLAVPQDALLNISRSFHILSQTILFCP